MLPNKGITYIDIYISTYFIYLYNNRELIHMLLGCCGDCKQTKLFVVDCDGFCLQAAQNEEVFVDVAGFFVLFSSFLVIISGWFGGGDSD